MHKEFSIIKQFIRHIIIEKLYNGSQPEESYSKKIVDDDSFNQDSVYVPNKKKLLLKRWLKSMKLD